MALGTVYTAAPSWGLDPDWRCREVPSMAVALLDLGCLVIMGYLCELTSQAPTHPGLFSLSLQVGD